MPHGGFRSLVALPLQSARVSGARLLGLESQFQVHVLLKEHNVPLQYTAALLEDDLQAHRKLGILPSR
jgi:hypothetical protein